MPSTVCMPGKFADLCDDLNEDQIKLVHEMGLGPLLNVRSMSIRRILLESLADGYSETDRSFTVGEHVVPICIWDVECILGLPNQGEKITISKNRADPKLFALYKGDKSITFTHLEKQIRSGIADEHFIRMFVLYAIGTVLAPCSKEYVSSHYLEVVADISKIKKYNWAEFTLEYLLTNLAEFKKNKRSGLVGNLALLQVWYFEHFQAYGDDFAYDHHEHPLIKNWDQQQCDKRMVFDAKNKMGAAKVVMCLRVNYSDTHFTCDPIVDGIIDESPKETNDGCFEDEKKHTDLDGLDYDARHDIGHQTDNLEGGEPNFEARLRVVEERTRLVPKLFSKMQAIERMLGYNHGLSLDYDMDMRSGNPSLQDQLSLIPSIAHKLDNVMAQLIGKRRPMVSEVLPRNSQETKKLRTHCKEEVSNIVSPLKKKADPHASTVVGMVKTRVNQMASNIGKPNTFQCTDARKAHGTSIEEVKSVDFFSRETSTKNAKVSSPTPLEKVESIANLEVSNPTSLEGVKSIEMFSSETPLKNKVKSNEENEVSSPTLVDKIKRRTHRKPSKLCSSPYVRVKSRAKFVPDNIHIDDITKGLDLSDLEVAAIKFVQKQLVLDAERVVVCIGQIELICSKMASLIRPVNENGVKKWLYDDIINLYATMFNSLWAEESVKYALSTFDSKFLITVGKEWLTHSKFIRKQKKRANELCRSLIRHDMVPVPMNIDEDHWWLVVINLAKQEWQILDSYDRTLDYYVEATWPFRNGVHSILQSFASSMESRWSNLDVLSWPVVVVKEIPRQYDICSCGIFTIKYMKNWNGSELTAYFRQEHMETFRKKMPSEILLSSLNKISVVVKEVRDMADV